MKKNAFIRKTVVLFLTIISVLGLQLISVNAKSPTYQQVPTMAYLKVESGQAYLSYANSAPQLFYEPMNGETVRLTQKICTGAWTDGKIFYYASGNKRVPTKVSLYKYTIKTGKTENEKKEGRIFIHQDTCISYASCYNKKYDFVKVK